jgi:TonB-linked SusC/RagA family outer membrane protein
VLSHSHNVGLTGGTDKTKFSLSGTYDYNGGLMPDNDFSRFAFMFKLNHDISKNLKFNLKANVSDQLVNGQGTQGGTYKIRTTQAISSVATKGLSEFITPDFASMTDEEYEEWQDSQLTLAEQAKRYWRKRNNRKYGFNASLDWTIIKGLKAHVEGGYEYQFNETKNWWGHTTNQASYVGGLPLADWTKVNVRTIRESVNLSYDKRINTDHHLNVMVGQEYRNQMQDQNYMYGTRYSKSMSPDDVFANFASQGDGAILRAESTVAADVRLLSFFGRVNYDYKDRYLLTVTFREDGSSKFAHGKQWGFFPAAAASWRIVEEPFMESTKKWLSNLKFRLSYGKVGNNRLGNNTFVQLYNLNSGSKRYGVGESANTDLSASSVLANPNITWEKRTTRNLGLDFGFFRERLTGSIEYYWNNTTDLLINHDISAAGYTSVWENCAETSNKGVELSLNGVLVQKKNFSLNANFNIGFDKSNVEKIANGLDQMTFPSGWAGTDNRNQQDYIVRVGDPIGLIYGWKTSGYYKTTDFEGYDAANGSYTLKEGVPTTALLGGAIGIRPGTIKLQDISGPDGTPDGVVDANDITVIGDTNADFTGGFGLSGTLYDFDFSANFTFTYGNDIYNANKIATSQQYRSGTYPNMLNDMRQANAYSYMNPETGTLLTSLEDLAYYNEGGNGTSPKAMWSPYSFGSAVVLPTDWAIEDASFLRLQSVTIGYTLPSTLTKKAGIQRLRVYVTGSNLFCITNYSGYDPEVSSYSRNSSYSGLTPGIDYSSYPKSRAFTFGLNLTL